MGSPNGEGRTSRQLPRDLQPKLGRRLPRLVCAEADINPRRPKALAGEAWRIADRLRWTRTYDAEYLALARLLRCKLVTTDAKLKAVGMRVVEVVGPTEL